MRAFRLRRPSPALAISLFALFVALGGGAYAATSSDTKTDKKIANSAAKSYFNSNIATATVSHANTAASATNANHATSADSATNATNATNAQTASIATAIGSVSYVKGNAVTAPANGGSGFGDAGPSIADCPAGTVAIGSGASTPVGGVEVSELKIAGTSPGAPPTEVTSFFDNFTNVPHSGNYVIAVCVAANSVNNPGSLSRLRAAVR